MLYNIVILRKVLKLINVRKVISFNEFSYIDFDISVDEFLRLFDYLSNFCQPCCIDECQYLFFVFDGRKFIIKHDNNDLQFIDGSFDFYDFKSNKTIKFDEKLKIRID